MATFCRTCHKGLRSAGSTAEPDEVVFFHAGSADHPADPVRHPHDGTHCWTATLCEGLDALAKLRDFAADKNDAELDRLIDAVEVSITGYTDESDRVSASDFAVGDIVTVASWGSTEFRVTGHSRLRDMSDVFHMYVDVVRCDSSLSGHELPEDLTKVR